MKQLLQLSIFVFLLSAVSGFCLPPDSLPVGGWITAEGGTTAPCLRVLTVIPGEALDSSGIKPDDVILGCDSLWFNGITNDVRIWFKNYIYRLQPGDTVLLHALRSGMTNAYTYTRTAGRPLQDTGYYGKRISAVTTPQRTRSVGGRIFSLLTYPFTIFTENQLSENILSEFSVTPVIPIVATQLVTAAMVRQDAWHTPFIDYVMQHPAQITTCGKQYADDKISRFDESDYALLLDDQPQSTAISLMPDPAGHGLSYFTQALSGACRHVLSAFPSNEAARRIAKHLPAILNQVDTWFYLHIDTNTEQYIASHDVVSLGCEYEPEAIDRAVASLIPWCSRENQSLLLACINTQSVAGITSKGCHGTLLAVHPTAWGDIVIGGPGNNRYDTTPLAIIDTGGDDTYTGRAARGPDKPVSVTIDWSGNDTYLANTGPGVAAGVCGVDILIDYSGNDLYSGSRWGLGAGYFGRGLLVDHAGNDRYIGERFVQGVGLFGKGVLVDRSGHDSFIALRFAQGVGLPGGEGSLCDLAGNDLYFSTLGSFSEYDTPGIYSGMSQGFGFGFRLIASGGIGSLIDMAGNDRYESGNFSQGGGYYLGSGILYDNAGDDIYTAMRYCQGFSAHTAAGVLIDISGNDTYTGTVTANQGLAWDTSVAGFYDGAGDDVYSSKGLALGAACIRSYAEFFDRGGKDTYTFSGRSAAGYSRSSDASTNVAIFCDSGGETDTYISRGRTAAGNDIIETNNTKGIFIDI